MPLALIPLMLLVVPIVEITVFILVGNAIGLWPTLVLVLGSAVVGALLLRRQGLSTLLRIQQETRAGRMPGRDLVHGMMILVAGILLLTPGLVTDAIGYLLFVPAIRDLGWRFLKGRVTVMAASRTGSWRAGPDPQADGRGAPQAARSPLPGQPGRRPPADVIDLEGTDFERRPNPNSPWSDGKDGTIH